MVQINNSMEKTAVSNLTLQQIQADVQETLEEVMGDASPEMMSEMSAIFLEDAVPLINQMKDGLGSQDLKIIRMAAHALKGSSATIGLEEFAKLCRIVETSCKQEETDQIGSQIATVEAEYAQIEQALSAFLL